MPKGRGRDKGGKGPKTRIKPPYNTEKGVKIPNGWVWDEESQMFVPPGQVGKIGKPGPTDPGGDPPAEPPDQGVPEVTLPDVTVASNDFIWNLDRPYVPYGDVAQVDGDPANVGKYIQLASGASLCVMQDGAYYYNPNGAFDWMNAADNGSTSDSFEIYAQFGQGTQTINITASTDVGDNPIPHNTGGGLAGTGWTDNTDGSYSHTTGTTGLDWTATGLTASKVYEVSYEIANRTAGQVTAQLVGSTTEADTARTTNERFLWYVQCPASPTDLRFLPDGSFDGDIVNPRIREVLKDGDVPDLDIDIDMDDKGIATIRWKLDPKTPHPTTGDVEYTGGPQDSSTEFGIRDTTSPNPNSYWIHETFVEEKRGGISLKGGMPYVSVRDHKHTRLYEGSVEKFTQGIILTDGSPTAPLLYANQLYIDLEKDPPSNNNDYDTSADGENSDCIVLNRSNKSESSLAYIINAYLSDPTDGVIDNKSMLWASCCYLQNGHRTLRTWDEAYSNVMWTEFNSHTGTPGFVNDRAFWFEDDTGMVRLWKCIVDGTEYFSADAINAAGLTSGYGTPGPYKMQVMNTKPKLPGDVDLNITHFEFQISTDGDADAAGTWSDYTSTIGNYGPNDVFGAFRKEGLDWSANPYYWFRGRAHHGNTAGNWTTLRATRPTLIFANDYFGVSPVGSPREVRNVASVNGVNEATWSNSEELASGAIARYRLVRDYDGPGESLLRWGYEPNGYGDDLTAGNTKIDTINFKRLPNTDSVESGLFPYVKWWANDDLDQELSGAVWTDNGDGSITIGSAELKAKGACYHEIGPLTNDTFYKFAFTISDDLLNGRLNFYVRDSSTNTEQSIGEWGASRISGYAGEAVFYVPPTGTYDTIRVNQGSIEYYTIFTMTVDRMPAATDETLEIMLLPSEEHGAEEISDVSTDFSGTNWAYASSKWTHTAGSTAPLVFDATGLTANEVYEIRWNRRDWTTGSLRVDFVGSTTETDVGDFSDANGAGRDVILINELIRCPASPSEIRFVPSSDFDGSIDRLSIRKLTLGRGTAVPTPVLAATAVSGGETTMTWEMPPIADIDSDVTWDESYSNTYTPYSSDYGFRQTTEDSENWRFEDITFGPHRVPISIRGKTNIWCEGLDISAGVVGGITDPTDTALDNFNFGIQTAGADKGTDYLYVKDCFIDLTIEYWRGYSVTNNDCVVLDVEDSRRANEVNMSNVYGIRGSDTFVDNKRFKTNIMWCTADVEFDDYDSDGVTEYTSNRTIRGHANSTTFPFACLVERGNQCRYYTTKADARYRLYKELKNSGFDLIDEQAFSTASITWYDDGSQSATAYESRVHWVPSYPRLDEYTSYAMTDLEFEVDTGGGWTPLTVEWTTLPLVRGAFRRVLTGRSAGDKIRMRVKNGASTGSWSNTVTLV